MPLLNVSVSDKISATITLERSTADTLDAYASFTKTNADAVLDHALQYVFAKDKDFQKWLAEAPAKPTRSLRVKQSAAPTKQQRASATSPTQRGKQQDNATPALQ